MVAFFLSLLLLGGVDQTKETHVAQTEEPVEPPISLVPFFVRSVTISDDNTLAVGAGEGGRISVFSVKRQKAIYYSRTPGNLEIRAITFLPNTHIVVTVGDSQILYWDVDARKVVDRIPINTHPFSAAFSPNRRYLAYGNNVEGPKGKFVVYDLKRKKVLTTFFSSRTYWQFTWTRDSRRLLVTTLVGNKTLAYDIHTREERDLHLPGQREQAVIYIDPNADTICWRVEEHRICFYDSKRKKVLGQVRYPNGIESRVRFTSNSKMFVAVGCDGVVHLYDNKTYKHLGTSQRLHKNIIWDVQFSPDNNLIVTGGDDGKMNIIRVDEILGKEK